MPCALLPSFPACRRIRRASACFSRDGARILTASYDRTARRWDGTTGKEITALRRHEDGVTGACFFSPDGARIVTTSSDRTTRLWDAATSQQIVRIALDAAVTMVSVHAGMIALNDRLGRFHVFEAETFLSAKDSVSG